MSGDGRRYLVADYKTTWLGDHEQPHYVDAYHPRGWPRRCRGRLPAAGAAVLRCAAPVPALAAAGVRLRRALRRRALSLPARHVRAGHAGGRRAALRRLRVAPAERRWSRRSPTSSAGGRRPRERRRRREATYHRDTALHATGTAARLQPRRAARRRPTSTSPAGRGGGRGERRERAARRRVRRAGRPAGLGMPRPRPSRPADDGLGWPDADGWGRRVAGSPGRRIRGASITTSVGCTWTGTGARSARSPTTSPRGPPCRSPSTRPRSGRLDEAFPGAGIREQRVAAEVACTHRTTIVTGGPGTGKTTTIARLSPLLAEQSSGAAAPDGAGGADGKAAARIASGAARRAAKPRLPLTAAGSRGRAHGGDPAPAAGLATREPDAVPARPHTTCCPTTWSSSTRRRWCR